MRTVAALLLSLCLIYSSRAADDAEEFESVEVNADGSVDEDVQDPEAENEEPETIEYSVAARPGSAVMLETFQDNFDVR